MICKATIEDIDQIVSIEASLFSHPWLKKDFLYELEDNPFVFFYVIKEENQVIGYIDFWVTFDTCQIATIGVAASHQGKGFGNQMMELCIQTAIEKECSNISLEVRVSNKVAIQLYRSYGFVPYTVKKGYYKDGEDAFLMVKMLV